MKLLVEIPSCFECPHFRENNCSHPSLKGEWKSTNWRYLIPDWCPSLPREIDSKFVELPPDPILIDYLEERGYKEAADILRGKQ